MVNSNMGDIASESSYWLDKLVKKISSYYPDGEITLSSGISPSASYHIGHFREILTVDVLTWGLRNAGREAQHLHIVDNFDPLRKRYSFLPESFEEHVGKPVCLIPDPAGNCHQNYADHFYSEFKDNMELMNINPVIIKSYEDLYKTGRMNQRFEEVLENLKEIRRVFKEISNRDLDEDWTPIQVIGKDKKFFNALLKNWDKNNKLIEGLPFNKGFAKLNWRLDWPARWKTLGVMVEPHGRELASAGSAFQTGRLFASNVFNINPPIPATQYEPIYLSGETKKMSSSLGNLITPSQAFDIMPPEVLRYFVLRSRPDKPVYFDTGLGFIKFINEFKDAEEAAIQGLGHNFIDAYKIAVAESKNRVSSSIPFDQLITAYQTVLGKEKLVIDSLLRSGYEATIKGQKQLVLRELSYAKNWLDNFAPEEIKFALQIQMPKVTLSIEQKEFLKNLADKLISTNITDGESMHKLIHEQKESLSIDPKGAFRAIYQVVLAKDSGPKAGWFLAILDRAWLIKRLKLEG